MFTFFLILLSFSIHILANPTPQNSNDVIVADSYLNAEPVDDSDSLNSPQNILVAGTNLVGSPSIGCTSDASTNEISDESVPAGGINRRQTACPVDYGSMPESLTQTGKEPAIEKKPSETPNGRCSDVKLKLYTCGGPIVGHPEYPWSGSTDPFNDKVLNCVPGKSSEKNFIIFDQIFFFFFFFCQ